MNITDEQAQFAEEVVNFLRKMGIRVQEDLRNEKIGFKIREHAMQRVPYLLVIGDREVAEQSVSVRTREGVDLGSMSLIKFSDKILSEVAEKGRAQESVAPDEKELVE